MSIRVMNWVWEHSTTSGTELLMLLAIADCADDTGGNAYPSKQTLAHKTRLDRSTVRRVINRLEAGGHLAVQRGAGRRHTNIYTVRMPSSPVDNPVAGAGETGAERPRGESPRGLSTPQGEAQRPITGGTEPPEPSRTVTDPSTPPTADTGPRIDAVAAAVLSRLGVAWPLTPEQKARLAPKVTAAVVDGWPVRELAAHLAVNPDGVKSPYAVLASRLANLPSPHPRGTAAPRPGWCGHCDRDTRHRQRADGSVERCPDCHPLRAGRQSADGHG